MKPSAAPAVESREREDQRLMAQVARGDVAAFRTLYDRYKAPIMSYVFHIVQSQAVAEEVTQETFLKVFRSRESYTTEAKFTTWLWTIARNGALDHQRRKRELPLDEQAAESALVAGEPGALNDTERDLMDRSSRERLEECLAELPNAHREALTLRAFSELSYEEISETMKVPVSSVKNYIHRAKQALVRLLKEKGDG